MTDKLAALADRAYRIRRYALRMGEVQGQGYIGQALGMAEILAVAYGHALNLRPKDPEWEGRDRFLLSHGHYAIAFYAALIEAGIVPEEELETYGGDDSRLPMSGMATYTPGMEMSGGSLGYLDTTHFCSFTPNVGPFMEFKGNAEIPVSCATSSLKAEKGVVRCPSGPGFGVTLDPGFISKATVVSA